MTLQQEIQEVYEQAYREAWESRTPQDVEFALNGKPYLERDFYWCGFCNIRYNAIGQNRQLHKQVEHSKAYPNGFYLNIEEIGNKGNGDFEIQREAYYKVADHLRKLGYEVYAESRLD